jgi:hypothetical protein
MSGETDIERIVIKSCIFTDSCGSRSYGYRMHTDSFQTWCNHWAFIPSTPQEILREFCSGACDIEGELMNAAEHTPTRVTVDGTVFEWEEVKRIIFSETEK